jgi:hypothetical protein
VFDRFGIGLALYVHAPPESPAVRIERERPEKTMITLRARLVAFAALAAACASWTPIFLWASTGQ